MQASKKQEQTTKVSSNMRGLHFKVEEDPKTPKNTRVRPLTERSVGVKTRHAAGSGARKMNPGVKRKRLEFDEEIEVAEAFKENWTEEDECDMEAITSGGEEEEEEEEEEDDMPSTQPFVVEDMSPPAANPKSIRKKVRYIV